MVRAARDILDKFQAPWGVFDDSLRDDDLFLDNPK
jgi:hypothetical protein